jgi:chromosome segregation ATPase
MDAKTAYSLVVTLLVAWMALRGTRGTAKATSETAWHAQYLARLAQVEQRMAEVESELHQERESKLEVIRERDGLQVRVDELTARVAELEREVSEQRCVRPACKQRTPRREAVTA